MSAPRVLIVKLGALGDCLLALPALRQLRRSLPEAHIGWLVEARNAAVLEDSPDLDGLIVARIDAWRRRPLSRATRQETVRMLGELRGPRRPDLVVDLQGLFKSALLAWVSGGSRRLGLPAQHARERLSGLLLSHHAEVPRGSLHVTDVYLAVARHAVRLLGAVPAPLKPVDLRGLMVLGDREREWAEQAVRRHGLERFGVVNPGASWASKRWAPARYGLLARLLVERRGLKVFVAYGAGEEEVAAEVVRAAASPAVVSFPSSVRELAALLERASLFVGGDTGPYHLARVMGTPCLGIFGPTDPERNGPRPSEGPYVWGKVHCSPCYARTCPTRMECLDGVGAEEVFRALATLEEPAPEGSAGGLERPGPGRVE